MRAQWAVVCWSACLHFPVHAQLLWQEQEQPLQQESFRSPCELLAATFPGQVLVPHHKAYSESQSAYWSAQQADLTPDCRFYPHNARDLQEAFADIIIPHNVTIAIASGGHSSNTGASNIENGITIDLGKLNQIRLTDQNRAVTLGPGARWSDVYAALEPYNLIVSGGRVAHVGVGGYVLGGGLSWFSNEHGWTCDSVLEFEVVTPQGQILWASNHYNDDLFYALKGSLGAFGIVTKIRLPTVENAAVYGGALAYDLDNKDLPQLFEALQTLLVHSEQVPAQSGYLSLAWLEAKKHMEYTAYLVNTEANSDHVESFKAIPYKASSLRRTTIGLSAEEISESNPLGRRRARFTLTSRSSTKTMLSLHDLITSFASKLNFDADGILGVTYQPLTVAQLKAANNIFNLDAYHGPLLIIMVEIWWDDASRDEYFEGSAKNLRTAMEQKLAKSSALHPFLYPNYAAKDQDPFTNLAPSQKGMLNAIKKKYDPDSIWQRLVPGIWHI